MATTLIPTWTLGGLDLTSYPFAIEFGGDHGAPESLSELVTSLLADGDLVRPTRHGNREISIVVLVEGASLGELAENEAVLRAECTKPRNTLAFNPGDFDSPVSVFEVLMAQMRQPRDETQEAHLMRRWELTLTCAPFARSADPVTVAALTPPGALVSFTVSSADTTTGWTASGGSATSPGPVTVTDQGSYVQALVEAFRPVLSLALAVTATSMATTNYLRVEVSGDTLAPPRFQVEVDGAWSSVYPTSSTATSSGTTLHYLDASKLGTTLTGLRVSKTLAVLYSTATIFVNVHDVMRTNSLAQVSPRQITRVIDVGGTERTPGSLHVSSADGLLPLTDMVVHTCPEDGSGYSPPLRRWRTAGQAVTTAGTAFSGAYESVTGVGVQFDTPTSSLPEGGYVLAAYMRTPTPGLVSIAWSTSTIFPGGTVEEGFTNDITRFAFPDDGWQFVPLATLSLPSVRTKAGMVRTIIQVPTGPTVYLDEAWLFREDDDCALTIVRSSPRPHLWLDSADGGSPVPTVWVGSNDTTRVHPGTGLIAQGNHVLSPGGTAVFTAALTDDPATEATFYPRWHSNAAS